MNEATWQFVRCHAEEDVRQLALAGCPHDGVDLKAALQQIAGMKTARQKLPSWAQRQDILYPPHLNMEQSSSEATARYKAEVAWRVCGLEDCPGKTRGDGKSTNHAKTAILDMTLIDLTGGMGVDFSFMARGFHRAVYVEQQEQLCLLARHNLPLLGLNEAEVACATAQDFIDSPAFRNREDQGDAFVFLDPARRDLVGRRTYAISDCTPDALALLPRLMTFASKVMLKLSPMLDWHKAVADIQGVGCGNGVDGARPHICHVAEVHCVATDGECKELLLVVKRGGPLRPLRVVCVEGDRRFCYEYATIASLPTFAEPPKPAEGMVLLVPGAATMKAGCFRELEETFGVRQVSTNSHLFLATAALTDCQGQTAGVADVSPNHEGRASSVAEWPGRVFHIQHVTGLNKKEIAPLGICQANVAVRNFPMTAEELRRKLKMKDGGEVFVFATTLENKQRVLLWCKKM